MKIFIDKYIPYILVIFCEIVTLASCVWKI